MVSVETGTSGLAEANAITLIKSLDSDVYKKNKKQIKFLLHF